MRAASLRSLSTAAATASFRSRSPLSSKEVRSQANSKKSTDRTNIANACQNNSIADACLKMWGMGAVTTHAATMIKQMRILKERSTIHSATAIVPDAMVLSPTKDKMRLMLAVAVASNLLRGFFDQ